MSAFTQIDKSAAKKIREILNNELPDLLAPYGLKFELGNGRYDDESVKFTGFRLSIEGALSPAAKALQEELESRATGSKWGTAVIQLDADKIVDYKGKKYTLIGYKPRSRKYPFILKNLSNGNDYKFPVDLVEQLFAKEVA